MRKHDNHNHGIAGATRRGKHTSMRLNRAITRRHTNLDSNISNQIKLNVVVQVHTDGTYGMRTTINVDANAELNGNVNIDVMMLLIAC